MPGESRKADQNRADRALAPDSDSAPRRVRDWAVQFWRPAATVVAIALAMLLTWHVINGKHGLSVWHQKRAEDRQLRTEIEDLEQENAHLREHVDRLKQDPNEIEHEAREKLHYAKPGEVVYTLPATPQAAVQPAAPAGKPGIVAATMSVLRDVVDAAAHLFGGGSRQ
jgi:cell division protein FtsB